MPVMKIIITGTVGLDKGPYLEKVAQIVSENHEQWVAAGLLIERCRLQTKAAIRAATSVAEIEFAYASMWA